MSITSVSGRRRETRASLTQPCCEQPLADAGEIDQRHRPRLLVERGILDRLAVHPVDAGDLDPLHREAGAADQLADLGADHLRQPHRDEAGDHADDRAAARAASAPTRFAAAATGGGTIASARVACACVLTTTRGLAGARRRGLPPRRIVAGWARAARS